MKNLRLSISWALLFICVLLASAQTQIGSTIYGDVHPDKIGWDVATSDDGKTIVIGASSSSESQSAAGKVVVYRYEDGDWVKLGNTLYGVDAFDKFGTSVDISADGSVIIVGAEFGKAKYGSATVFEYKSGSWEQKGNTISGTNENDALGYSVAISSDGKIIAASAHHFDDPINGNEVGQVQVLYYSGGIWTAKGSPIIGEKIGEAFGNAIDLSSEGNTLIAGAYSNDLIGENAGVVKVYTYSSNWTLIGDAIYGEIKSEFLGSDVAISGDGKIIAMGSPYYSLGSDQYIGRVKVFRNSGNKWIQVGNDIVGPPQSFTGNSLALSRDGGSLIVGTLESAAVYKINTSSINQIGNTINAMSSNDATGAGLALSEDGKRIIVSSPQHKFNGLSLGAVRIFSFTGSGGINNRLDYKTTLAPNPFHSSLNIESSSLIKTINIYNAYGALISKYEVNSTRYVASLDKLNNGVYFVVVNLERGVETYRAIKEY